MSNLSGFLKLKQLAPATRTNGTATVHILIASLALVASIGLAGCASTLNKKVDAELAQETAIRTHADLQTEADTWVNSAPGLTPDQRKQLITLKASTRSQLDDLYSQSIKLRSLMLKRLITTDYNEGEVDLIKSRIKKVESDRISVMFSAIEQANTILGRNLVDNRVLMESFFEGFGHGGQR